MVRQAWLMAEVGALLIGFTCLLAVGCSGDTGSQPSGSQDSEVSQSAEAGSERTGPRESESTHEVAQHGGSLEAIPPNTITDFLLRVDGITYQYDDKSELYFEDLLNDEDLGPLVAEVNRQGTSSTTSDQPASKGVPVYAVKGYDSSFRLAARMDDRLMMFEAFFNPKANEASDVLDIGGKVSSIDIDHWRGPVPAGLTVGRIEEPEKVERLVRELLDAPLKPTSPDHFGTIGLGSVPTNPDDYTGTKDLNHYGISFYLKDGTWAIRDYRMDTGRLSISPISGSGVTTPASGIVAPPAFREAIEEAAKGFIKELQAQKAKIQRRKRSCSDTRTSQQVRRINSSGDPVGPHDMAYTTNDVYPSGPWGGVLRGTGENDKLVGENGEDEVYGLGGDDTVEGGACDDKLYGGPGRDDMDGDGRPSASDSETNPGKDILYGGDGNDTLIPGKDGQRDEVHCGKGMDVVYVGYSADKFDYVDNSCEEKQRPSPIP